MSRRRPPASFPRPHLSPRGWLLTAGLLCAYILLQPWLPESLRAPHPGPRPDGDEVADRVPEQPGMRGPLAESTPDTSSPVAKNSIAGTGSSGREKLGQLTDLGGKRYRSTAGLIYAPLRSEHRLDHVLRHAADDPGRPVHGVFLGTHEEILALIDEAWQRAARGVPPEVVREQEGGRAVLVVDLGRPIGFMGGESGKRRGYPPCRHLQLVVEGHEVITAYPVILR